MMCRFSKEILSNIDGTVQSTSALPKKVKKLEYQKFFGQIGEPPGQLEKSPTTVIYLDTSEMEILLK